MKLAGKTALITGASSGIGKAVALELASLGANIILAARRIDLLEKLKHELIDKYKVDSITIQLDVSKLDQVKIAINNLSNKWQNIDILVNNAGLALGLSGLQDGDIDQWNTMIDVNLKGLLYVTRTVLPIMIKNNCGHIVNIGSTAGHDSYFGGNVYSATKHAVRSLSKSLRIDLLGKPIRITEVDPGAVGGTEFSIVRWNSKEKAEEFYSEFNALAAEDIAETVSFCLTRKPHVNISEVVVCSIDQASANHINRKNKLPSATFSRHKED